MDFKREHLLLLFSLLVISIANSAVSTSIAIGNSPPSIGNFSANSAIDAYGSDNKTIWCNATITDNNGRYDIQKVNATFWNPAETNETSTNNNSNHYTNTSCLLTNMSSLSKNASCYFNLVGSYPGIGNWFCKIYAFDNLTSASSVIINISVYKCGDSLCNYGENCTVCPTDCGNCPTSTGPGSSGISGSGTKKTNKTSIVVPEQLVQKKSEQEPQTIPAFCGDSLCLDAEDCNNCAADCGQCPAAPPVSSSGPAVTPLQGGIFAIAVLGTIGISIYLSRKFSQASKFRRGNK